MPANEETIGESFYEETSIKNQDSIYISGLTSNKSDSSLEKLVLSTPQNGTKTSSGKEELSTSLCSLPVRKEHEKFIRESVDLILNDAIFEVGI